MVGDGDHDELFARSSEIDNHGSAHEAHGSSDSALLQASDGMSLDGISGDGRSRDGMPHGFSPDHHNRIGERENMLPHEPTNADQHIVRHQGGPGLAWRIATLPFSAIRGSFNVMHGAIGLGMWIAGGILTHSLGALGLAGQQPRVEQRNNGASPLLPLPQGVAEARDFIRSFEREYGIHHPAFQELSFLEALRRANEEFRFLLVYIHSPDHEHTPLFVQQTLCSDSVVDFINSNFVIWGGSIRANEGFRMSNTLKASTFPFCAVVMASSNQRVTLLQQVRKSSLRQAL
jgi:FAS-associated factor 2